MDTSETETPTRLPSRQVWQHLGFESLAADRDSLGLWQRGGPAAACRFAAKWWQPPAVFVACTCLAVAVVRQPLSALQILVCLWTADLYTGCVHFVFDHFEASDLDVPFLRIRCGKQRVAVGESLLGPLLLSFHQHHADPSYIWRCSYLTSAAEIFVSVAPQFLLTAVYTPLLLRLAPPLLTHHESSGGSLRSAQQPLEAAVAIMPAVVAWKTFGLLYGEFSHRQAHAPPHLVPRWAAALQRARLMMPRHVHHAHHRGPRAVAPENNFCQIGVANPAVDWLLRRVTRRRWAWLAGMLALTLGDFVLLSGAFAMLGASGWNDTED